MTLNKIKIYRGWNELGPVWRWEHSACSFYGTTLTFPEVIARAVRHIHAHQKHSR